MPKNFIYSLYETVEDQLLRKYYLEIKFYSDKSQYLDAFNTKNATNHQGDFKCYLPLILSAQNIDEGNMIRDAILNGLTQSGAKIIACIKLEECTVPQVLESKKTMLENKFKNGKFIRLKIETKLPIPIPAKEIEEYELIKGIDTRYDTRIDKFLIAITKVRPDAIQTPEDYHVYIDKKEGDKK